MNFLDAHKVFYGYADAFVDGHRMGQNEQKLSFYCQDWKYKLVKAYQIVLSHGLLWGYANNDFFNAAWMIFGEMDGFFDDKLSKEMAQARSIIEHDGILYKYIHKNKIENAKKFFTMHFPDYNSEENIKRKKAVSNTWNNMIAFKRDVTVPQIKSGADRSIWLTDYVQKTYELADIEYQEDYVKYFITIDEMRDKIGPGELFYAYRDEIIESRI